MAHMNEHAPNLLDRVVYSMAQVDRLLALNGGTAHRWIDGYTRAGKRYDPVVRIEPTGDELVTWGEFVEARLLSEYRDAGVPLLRMRPAVERLREQFDAQYPLAHARPYLDVAGQELVLRAQEQTGLAKALHLVVVRNGRLMLAPQATRFVHSVDFGTDAVFAERIFPSVHARSVVIDPRRQFGEPVVRSVPTEVIAEQVRAGDSMDMIAGLFELSRDEVEDAVRYELALARPLTERAA